MRTKDFVRGEVKEEKTKKFGLPPRGNPVLVR